MGLAKVSPRTKTPILITIITALFVSIIAGLLPIDEIAALANAGTLAAFTAVGLCMLIMRVRAPDAPRTFRTPLAWPVGIIAVGGCLYLFASLPQKTQFYFCIWNAIGLVVYFLYSSRRSRVAVSNS
jgi:basic amino acid/polyamine antiporter, APA family